MRTILLTFRAEFIVAGLVLLCAFYISFHLGATAAISQSSDHLSIAATYYDCIE